MDTLTLFDADYSALGTVYLGVLARYLKINPRREFSALPYRRFILGSAAS